MVSCTEQTSSGSLESDGSTVTSLLVAWSESSPSKSDGAADSLRLWPLLSVLQCGTDGASSSSDTLQTSMMSLIAAAASSSRLAGSKSTESCTKLASPFRGDCSHGRNGRSPGSKENKPVAICLGSKHDLAVSVGLGKRASHQENLVLTNYSYFLSQWYFVQITTSFFPATISPWLEPPPPPPHWQTRSDQKVQ